MDDRFNTIAGWVLFAGIMVFMVGVLNCIWGIAAIDNANFFVANQKYIISDLNTWGWVMLVLGALQVVAPKAEEMDHTGEFPYEIVYDRFDCLSSLSQYLRSCSTRFRPAR